MNSNESDLYAELFFQLNTTRDGALTKDQLLEAFWSNGFNEIGNLEIDKLYAYCDDDGEGTLSFEEFF